MRTIKLSQMFLLMFATFLLMGCGQTEEKVMEPVEQPGGYSNINNATLDKMLGEGVILVDIRRPEEWTQTGTVAGSHKITFFTKKGINPNFVTEFMQIAQPTDKVALICRTGNRTKAASKALAQQLGYKHVYNVQNGITSWIQQGRPVEK